MGALQVDNLNNAYAEALRNVKNFSALSLCRNLDHPNNWKEVCLQNFQTYSAYFKTAIVGDIMYHPRRDYVLVANITNCLSSVKSYLNRKIKAIESKDILSNYKLDLKAILTKYWKSKRNSTSLDKLIILRDIFEHEKIPGISIKTTFGKEEKTRRLVMINEINLNELFKDSLVELEKLDIELRDYVEEKLSELELRKNILFLNAFYRNIGKKQYSHLHPEETSQEKEHFDNLILSLK